MRPPIIPSYPRHVAASDSEAAPDFKAEDCRAVPHFTTFVTLKALFLTLLLGTTLPTQAQQYPIQATVQLIPPYSVYLSDYANERLAVQLQLRDLSKGEIPVRLRWQIRGAGISLETKTTYLPPANTVGVGIPLRLDGYDLAPYLRPENLLGSGVGASWRRSAQLPEGLYTFCVQVLDDVTGAVVSNSACATAWLLRHDPPLLNLPEAEAQPEARDPQQLTFQWTPRHTGRPNAHFQTEYDFRLVEIWPANRNPNDAMLSSVPLYETTISTTMLVYGPAEPPLVPGRRYAWQVRARSLVNGESLDMFNNQGYSEVRSFRWGNACLTLPDVQAEALTGGRIRLRWEAPPTHSRYRVQYRQQGTTRWYEQETFQPEVILTRLSPNTAYEYQVGGYCGSIAAELTRLASISTREETVPEYACGLPVPATNREAVAPLPILMVGDMIQAGDFPVTVTESSGQQGQFSGKGTVSLPWLRESVAQVTFQDVQINEHYQLTAGQLTVNGVVMKVVPDELTQPLYDAVAQAERALEQLPSTPPADTIIVEGEVTEVYVNEQGQVVAVDPDGNEVVVAEEAPKNGETIAVQDSQGNSHTVNATSNGGRGNQASTIPNATQRKDDSASVDFTVQFQANEQQVYGFDQKQHDALAADYVQAPINNENYWVAWKSVASGRTDPVGAVAIPRDTFPASVRFRTLTGPSVAQPTTVASERQLPVVGTTHEAVEALTAYVTEQDTAGNETEITVGQLNVISYDQLRQKLVIVPVNEAAAPNATLLSQELNRIYGQAIAHWEVVIDDPLVIEADQVPGPDEGNSGILASFPQKMRQFNRAFKRSRNIDKDAYYLFLVPESGSSRAGFMPFKQQFGYIFTQQTSQLSKIIAHELGHGAFRLRHTFSEFGLAQGTTDNLMDYSEGTKLYKYQWDNVHDPEAMVGWLQEDEESALKSAMPIVNALREANKKDKKLLDLSVHGTSVTTTTIKLNAKDVRIVVITKLKREKNSINPSTPRIDEDEEAFGEKGKFAAIKFFQNYDATVVVKTDWKDGVALQDYLLNKGSNEFVVELYEGSEKEGQDSIFLISPVPAMPDIRAKIVSNSEEKFKIKLVIEYLRQCTGTGEGRTPNQSESFPTSGWHEIEANEEWNIDFGLDTETNRPKIRGGIAYLITQSRSEQTDTVRFFIKGSNPTVAQINTYLNQAPYNQIWFFKKIAFHESGTPNNINGNARQYNVYSENHENLNEGWNAFSRCPNFGPPCGWGLMQLDNPAPPAQALWDWQANIQAGYDLLIGEKRRIVRNRMINYMTSVTDWNDEFPDDTVERGNDRNEGGIIYMHGVSNHFQNNEITGLGDHFSETPNNNEQSLLDASWMKAYNGLGEENRIFYYLESNGSNKPTWEISNTATYSGSVNYYVNSIGEQQTPD